MALTRYVLYVAGIAACTWLLAWTEISSPGSLRLDVAAATGESLGTSEYSSVEMIQVSLLAICVLLFAWVARDCPSQRPIAFTFGGVALACIVRELHFFLDTLVADNFSQVLVAVIAALLIVYVYRHRRRFRIAWLRLWPSPGLTLLFAGANVVLLFAQIVGREPLWIAILGEGYQVVVRLAVEEFAELMGYYLWLIGSFEYAYQARAIAVRELQPAAYRRRASRKPQSRGRF